MPFGYCALRVGFLGGYYFILPFSAVSKSLSQLLSPDQVQGRARHEPFDLIGGQGVLGLDGLAVAVGVLDFERDRFARRQFIQSFKSQAIVALDLVVVGGVSECQR